MEVTRYIFQSPSPNRVQVGTPDPSAKKESETQQKTQEDTEKLTKETNTALKEAETFVTTQKKDVEPTIEPKTIVAVAEVEKAKETAKPEVNDKASEVGQLNQAKNDIWSKGSDTVKNIRDNIWSRGSDNNGQSNNIWSRDSEDTQSHKVKPTVETFKQKLLDFFA